MPHDMHHNLRHIVYEESRSSEGFGSSDDSGSTSFLAAAANAAPACVPTAHRAVASSSSAAVAPSAPLAAPQQRADHDGIAGQLHPEEVCEQPDGEVDDTSSRVDEPSELCEAGQGSAEGQGLPWSKGSRMHEAGKCKPCHYVHTKLGCLNGEECNFCHIPHTKKTRPRPCKTKRMQCKRIVSMLEAATAKDPEQFAEATKLLSSQSLYLRSVVKSRSKGEDGEGGGAEAVQSQADGDAPESQALSTYTGELDGTAPDAELSNEPPSVDGS